MTIGDIFKESWLSISGNKIRSFLTVLGIIIGVMAVVIIVIAIVLLRNNKRAPMAEIPVQDIPEGTEVAPGTVITVTFEASTDTGFND